MTTREEREAQLDQEFEDWKKEHQGTFDKLEIIPGYEVKEYRIFCTGIQRSVLEEAGDLPCNEILRYQVCNGQVYRIKEPERNAFFGLSGDFLFEATNRLFATRVIPYLLANGCITCERCGKVYKVITP